MPLRVAVLGAGVTGLAAANHCREIAVRQGRDVRLIVLERAPRTGGCIETRAAGGYVAELGPDSLVTEKPAALELVRRLGLEPSVATPRAEFRGARIVRDGRLLPIPDDFRLFTPTSLAAIVRSGLFDLPGILRAAVEPLVPRRRGQSDESLASFVTRRFGRQVLERLAQPLVGGIYSGDPERLSMQATLPQMVGIERTYGSMVRGMRKAAAHAGNAAPAPRLVSLQGGLGSMIAALERRLGDAVRTSAEAVEVRFEPREGGARWTIALADGTAIDADAVLCALPARAAAGVLERAQPGLAMLLRSIRYHSVATVTLAYDAGAVPPLPACTGFVVPFAEGRSIMSVTISSQKFAGRAPDGKVLLRAFAGGALQPALAAKEDAELLATVRRELRELLGIAADPAWTLVRRWPRALPEYAVGHTELVTRIEREASRLYGFALAGSAYRGVGIADCVRSGEAAARDLFEQLTGRTGGLTA